MRGFWIGVAAGCAFLVIELVGRVVAGAPTIPELIQDRLVLFLPGPVFSFVLDRLLYLGKPALFASLLLLQLVLAGLGGLVFRRWREPVALAVVPWLVTGLILLPIAGQGIFAGSVAETVVSLLAFAAYAVALVVYSTEEQNAPRLVAAGRSAPEMAAGPAAPATSRRLIVGGGLSFLASLVLGRGVIGNLPSLPPVPDAPATGSGAVASTVAPTAVAAVPSMVTPPDSFYVVSKNLIDPVVDAASWHLQVTGLVSHPIDLKYNEILALPAQQTYQTLECISNEVGGDLISNGLWTGTRLADILHTAGVASDATAIHFTSVDGYTDSMAVAKALDPSTLLAYKLDGQPLPSKHGFPLRVLGTGTYGMKNPKWLTKIEVVKEALPGFWEQQGWDSAAIVQTMARIDAPQSGVSLHLAPLVVEGIAFAGSRGIQRVDVSTDGGKSWNAAELKQPLGPNTWVFWQYAWQPGAAGGYTVVARAIDGTGHVQTASQAETYPSGATGYDSIDLRVDA